VPERRTSRDIGPPQNQYWSAGEEEIPGLGLPSWNYAARAGEELPEGKSFTAADLLFSRTDHLN
jgi:hypothetical protein